MVSISLEEKEDVFWEEHAPRAKFMFPAEFCVWNYRDILAREKISAVELASVSPSAQNIINAIKHARESKLHAAVAVLDTSFMGSEESLYVLDKGLSQALLTKASTPSSKHPEYRREHAVVEYREGYNLGKSLLELTLDYGHSPLTIKVLKPNLPITLT